MNANYKKVAYIMAGGEADIEFCRLVLANMTNEDILIAADAGLRVLRELELEPHLLVGDFDTLEEYEVSSYTGKREAHDPIKNASDTELAVHKACEMGYIDIVILGVFGGRLDHTFANVDIVCAYLKKGVHITLLDARNKLYAIDGALKLSKKEQFGKYLSLFPAYGVVENLYLKGLKYPLYGMRVDKYETPSLLLSNEILDLAEISFDGGIVFVVESKDKI